MVDQAYYAKGFQKSISNTHSSRNVENSGKFVTTVLKPNFKMLDVGCGPGSITIDFAKSYLTCGGSIIGIEPTHELVDASNELKNKENVINAEFQLGSIYNIPYPDNTFDLVYSHQVIVHIKDPIKALRELLRVIKPNGFVCVRDADIESTIISPEKFNLLKEYSILLVNNNVSSDIKAGRYLKSKAIKAGYDPSKIKLTISSNLFSTKQEKQDWANMYTNRIKNAGEKAYPEDHVKDEEVKNQILKLYPEWVEDDTSLISIPSFEMIYQKKRN
ncbi:hypothetical protein KGF54_002209 [Candida jiufengensis]|uniref:uncharacterized protein n=1 Tax=Candida jiufengensis TaxID=497108 RepID=UPI00222430A8|nr:uncharacterized protein KGF54_002209 [Candida jiufengensis]KAI5954434.1 hypothetical protein KGF54_002209 [Candida jiufengensis]